MVWILHKIPVRTQHQVFARELHRWDPESEGVVARHPELDLRTWPAKQKEYISKYPTIYKGKVCRNESNGLYFYVQSDNKWPGLSTASKNSASKKPSKASTADALITEPVLVARRAQSPKHSEHRAAEPFASKTDGIEPRTKRMHRKRSVLIGREHGLKVGLFRENQSESPGLRVKWRSTPGVRSNSHAIQSKNSKKTCFRRVSQSEARKPVLPAKHTPGVERFVERFVNRSGESATASLRLIVPEDEQQGLAEWQHHALLHASPAKVYAELRQHYHWATM